MSTPQRSPSSSKTPSVGRTPQPKERNDGTSSRHNYSNSVRSSSTVPPATNILFQEFPYALTHVSQKHQTCLRCESATPYASPTFNVLKRPFYQREAFNHVEPDRHPYTLSHQSSCEMCRTQAVKYFQKKETRLRDHEGNMRAALVEDEKERRRQIYRLYAPNHKRYRIYVDEMIGLQESSRAAEYFTYLESELEKAESVQRESFESEMLKTLRAIVRCCYRKGWEVDERLQAMIKEERKRQAEMERVEILVQQQEAARYRRFLGLLTKQLVDEELKERLVLDSEEFKDWVRLLLLYRDGVEDALSETMKREEADKLARRMQFWKSTVQHRGATVETEEKDARLVLRQLYLENHCRVRQDIIKKKMIVLQEKEKIARERKVVVMFQELLWAMKILLEDQESVLRSLHISRTWQVELEQMLVQESQYSDMLACLPFTYTEDGKRHRRKLLQKKKSVRYQEIVEETEIPEQIESEGEEAEDDDHISFSKNLSFFNPSFYMSLEEAATATDFDQLEMVNEQNDLLMGEALRRDEIGHQEVSRRGYMLDGVPQSLIVVRETEERTEIEKTEATESEQHPVVLKEQLRIAELEEEEQAEREMMEKTEYSTSLVAMSMLADLFQSVWSVLRSEALETAQDEEMERTRIQREKKIPTPPSEAMYNNGECNAEDILMLTEENKRSVVESDWWRVWHEICNDADQPYRILANNLVDEVFTSLAFVDES